MKETDYFKRAAADAAFRKSEIEEQRSLMEIGKVLSWFLGAPLVVFTLYLAFTAEKESATWQLLFMAMLSTNYYGTRKTRIAALEAMENPKASPSLEEINAASPHR